MRSLFSKAFLLYSFVVAASLLQAGCGCGREGVSGDAPFVFPPGEGGSVNLCEAVTCPEGERCDPADGQCKEVGTFLDRCRGVTCPEGQTCDPADGQCKGEGLPCTEDADCGENERCDNGTCVPIVGPGGCTSDDTCPDDQVCKDRSCVAGCRNDAECPSGQICSPITRQCVISCTLTSCPEGQRLDIATCSCVAVTAGTCVVEFAATIALRADSPINDKFDIPSACFYYYLDPDSPYPDAYQSGRGLCPQIIDTVPCPTPEDPNRRCDNNVPCPDNPAESCNNECHNDLVCCIPDAEGNLPTRDGVGHEVFCDPPERIIDEDAQGRVLAVTRWPANPPQAPKPIKIFFNLDESGDSCRWEMPASEFPQFRLENSGLVASLIIDAGAARHEAGLMEPDPTLAVLKAEGNCSATTLNGQPAIALSTDEGKGLRFRINFFLNSIENNKEPFQSFFGSAEDVQIVPPPLLEGVELPPLRFTTDRAFANPSAEAALETNPALPGYEVEPLDIFGVPLHRTSDTASEMTLVTAVTIPHQPSNVEGSGLMGAQIGGAPLTAEISGTVVRIANRSTPITSIDDLRPQNCAVTGGTCQSDNNCNPGEQCVGGVCIPIQRKLILTMRSSFDGPATSMEVLGDPLVPDGGFHSRTCATGTIAGDSCDPLAVADLPYAKEPIDHINPPSPLISGLFMQEGMISIRSDPEESTETVTFNLSSEQQGAFRIVNFADLQGRTMGPGGNAVIQILFEPDTELCDDDPTGLQVCNKTIVLSQAPSPPLQINLIGHARLAAPEMVIEELDPKSPNATPTAEHPRVILAPDSTVPFPESIVGSRPKTKLFKISNIGVRPLTISGIDSDDGNKLYFRIGSLYRGTLFSNRTWISNQQPPYVISPTGDSNLFLFESYGPFGRVATEEECQEDRPARCDTGTLTITSLIASQSVPTVLNLSGKAKKDDRAILNLLIQDGSRARTLAQGGRGDTPDLVYDDPDIGTVKLFEVQDTEFSFRQDSSERAVYVRNTSDSPQAHRLVLRGIEPPQPGRFTFTLNPALEAAYGAGGTCVSNADLATCISLPNTDDPDQAGDQTLVRIGTLQFNPDDADSYSVFETPFRITADSVPTTAGPTVPPITGGRYNAEGNIDRNQAEESTKSYALRGAAGAPGGTKDLKVHRMIAGLNAVLADATQKVKILSTSTRGMVSRAVQNGLVAAGNEERFVDVFTVEGLDLDGDGDRDGMVVLDPVAGVAKIRGLFTPVEEPQPPASPTPSQQLNGMRIFSGPGTQTTTLDTRQPLEHYFQCAAVPGGSCPFFYIYLGDWGTTETLPTAVPGAPATCPSNKYAISASPSGNESPNWLNPRNEGERACMRHPGVLQDDIDGIYDPVTGEITFKDLAVRLFSPVTLDLGEADSTLRLSLTTECVTPDRVPDSDVGGAFRVPQDTLTPTAQYQFDRRFMPTNPLIPYVDIEGGCGERVLHGRRLPLRDTNGTLVNTDQTGTLDNLDNPIPGPFNFDLAGVARIRSGLSNAAGKLMYMVIKAEVGHRCANGTWVAAGNQCSPSEEE